MFLVVVGGAWCCSRDMWCTKLVFYVGDLIPTRFFLLLSFALVLDSSMSFFSPVVPMLSMVSLASQPTTGLPEDGRLYLPVD